MASESLRVGEVVRVRGERADGTYTSGLNYVVGFGRGDTLELRPTNLPHERDMVWRQP